MDVGIALQAMIDAGSVINDMTWPNVPPGPPGGALVKLQMWTTSQDECSKCVTHKEFVANFSDTATRMMVNGYMTFTPSYAVVPCPSPPKSELCRLSCINYGRYCVPAPDGDSARGFDGRDVVIANVRALCVYSLLSAAGMPQLWWNYSVIMSAECSFAGGAYSIACSDGVIGRLGVSVLTPAGVAACTGDTSVDAPNAMLDAQRAAQSAIAVFPTLIANGMQYRGDVEGANVLQFICSAFVNSAMAPPECIASLPNRRGGACDAGSFGQLECAADRLSSGQTECRSTAMYPFFECSCPHAWLLQGGSCKPSPHSPSGPERSLSGGAVFGIVVLVLLSVGGIAYGAYRFASRGRASRMSFFPRGNDLDIGLASYHSVHDDSHDEVLD